jgi:diguanylate cyclase (GGDEF)-like protein
MRFTSSRQTEAPFLQRSGQNLLRILLLVLAPALFWMGFFALAGYGYSARAGSAPYFVSPWLAGGWLAGGAVLFYVAVSHRHGKTGAWLVLAMIAVLAALLPDFAGAQGYRLQYSCLGMALALAAALSAMGVKISRGEETYRPDRFSIAIAILGTGISVAAAHIAIERHNQQIRERLQVSSQTLARQLRVTLTESVNLVRRQAERWETMPHPPSASFIRSEFSGYLRDIPAFQRFVFIDERFQIIHDVSQAGYAGGWLEQVMRDPAMQRWMLHAREADEPHLQSVQRTGDDLPSGVLVAPVNHAQLSGYILTRLDLQHLVSDGFRGGELPCCFRVLLNDTLILDTQPGGLDGDDERFMLNVELHHDLNLGLLFWHGNADNPSVSGALPETFLVFGLLFTFFTNSSQRLAYVARQRSRQLQHSALHDPLTGLPNRRMLEQILTEATERAITERRGVSLIFLDIDGIRMVNDSMGHGVGDQLLVDVALRLQALLPPQAAIARLEGGEFVVCLVGYDDTQVDGCARELIDAVAQPFYIDQNVLRLTAVAGIAGSEPDVHYDDPMMLVGEADLAMLKAKKEGRSTWHRYSSDLSRRVAERLALRNDLQDALEKSQLMLHYQPIVQARGAQVVSLEALMRWQHPEFGLISPAKFIPMAEESGQIVPLTMWALRTACADVGRLPELGLPQVPVAVNISAVVFQRSDFIATVSDVLAHSRIAPGMLELEITESVLLDDEAGAIARLAQLQRLGIKTSLDDFGTGYSSLSYLKTLPIDKVKIDRSFIVDVGSDPVDRAIVQGVIAMAHDLDLVVVVEGVETREQVDVLLAMGADHFQGFYFARPLPLAQLAPAFTRPARHPSG